MDQTVTADVKTPAPSDAEKKGRGPTRPAIRFADLLEDLRDAPTILGALKAGRTAKDVRELVKTVRAEIKASEKLIADYEELAGFLARVEELPPDFRRALVATLETEPK